MSIQFGLKGMSAAHDFLTRPSLRLDLGAASTSSSLMYCHVFFDNLFKTKDFHNGGIHRRVKTQPTFVRAQCRIEFNPIAFVHLDLALLIEPGNTEHDLSLRLHHTFNNGMLAISPVILQQGCE